METFKSKKYIFHKGLEEVVKQKLQFDDGVLKIPG
jgi:hypothetical protein